jgi:hypothetical protein
VGGSNGDLRDTERGRRQQDESKFCHLELRPFAKDYVNKIFVGRLKRRTDE